MPFPASALGQKPPRPNRGSCCALERSRCCPTGRRALLFEGQLIADDDKGALAVLALPVWKCRAVDVKCEGLVRLVDDVAAEMSDASCYNRLVLICRTAGPAT